jgi:hypothetical protein
LEEVGASPDNGPIYREAIRTEGLSPQRNLWGKWGVVRADGTTVLASKFDGVTARRNEVGRGLFWVAIPEPKEWCQFDKEGRQTTPQALFVFIPSTQAAVFARQFVERGLDKAGIALIGPGDLTDDEALQNMGDAMLGTVTAHFYSAAHASAANKARP